MLEIILQLTYELSNQKKKCLYRLNATILGHIYESPPLKSILIHFNPVFTL